MTSQTSTFKSVDWTKVTEGMTSVEGVELERRLRKLEQRSPRTTVSIDEVDPLKQRTAPANTKRPR
jgi:hypothetical protein